MDARLQRRVQRYGWDLAAADYEPLWQAQLACAQDELLARAALAAGESVLDVACGTGLVTFDAARAVGPGGRVVGVDLSDRMVATGRRRASEDEVFHASFKRMDAEQLDFPDASFDVVLCALGLMYVPDPAQAMREMQRVLRPGGRVVMAVWGERSRCGWATLFSIIDAEVRSEVCPLFFRLGHGDALAAACGQLGFEAVEQRRINTTLSYFDADEACRAAFVGGPVALAWNRFDKRTQARVCGRYRESIAPWKSGEGFRIPGEFVVVSARAPQQAQGQR